MFMLDTNDTRDAKALGMLQTGLIGWVTTVGAQGEPRSAPVWFYWDDKSIMVLTRPGTAKVAHPLAESPGRRCSSTCTPAGRSATTW